MNKNRKYHISAIFFVIAIILTIFLSLDYYRAKDCRNLKRIAADKDLRKLIISWVKSKEEDIAFLSNSGKFSGFVFSSRHGKYYSQDLFPDLDWDKLKIPNEHATIQLDGDQINYQGLNWKSVHSVWIGYGYRKHIIYEMKPGSVTKVVDGKLEKFPDNFSVSCRG